MKRFLGKNPFVYGHFWLSYQYLLCKQYFFLSKRRWSSHSHVIIFRRIFPTWRYLRRVYLTMKRSYSSSCVKEPEPCWEVHYKGDLHDYTDNTSSIVPETLAINLVETQPLAWTGRASLICPELKIWRKSQAGGVFAVSSWSRHVVLLIRIVNITPVKGMIQQLGFGSLTQALQHRSMAAESEKLSETSHIFDFRQRSLPLWLTDPMLLLAWFYAAVMSRIYKNSSSRV